MATLLTTEDDKANKVPHELWRVQGLDCSLTKDCCLYLSTGVVSHIVTAGVLDAVDDKYPLVNAAGGSRIVGLVEVG